MPGRYRLTAGATMLMEMVQAWNAGCCQRAWEMILETAVGRPPGCVRRGVWQGTTRRNSPSIPTSCNAARRRAVRALVVVAPLTSRVSPRLLNTLQQYNHLLATRSGQLRFLG